MRKYKGLEVALESALDKLVEADEIKDLSKVSRVKVNIQKDFFIKSEKDLTEKEIIGAIKRNINGWQWSGSKVSIQIQPEKEDWRVALVGNIIHQEDIKK